MKINVGTFYENKTKKYLLPILKLYGKQFKEVLNSLCMVAVGIGDFISDKSGLKNNSHLFILVDTQKTDRFFTLLSYLRSHSSYQDDYAFDLVHKGKYHMFVIKIPVMNHKSLEMFKQSAYSKMFEQNEINIIFTPENFYQSQRGVFFKTEKHKQLFIEKVSTNFGVDKADICINPEITEYDLPINLEEETFNKHLENEDSKRNLRESRISGDSSFHHNSKG